jgi:hypothetical protein
VKKFNRATAWPQSEEAGPKRTSSAPSRPPTFIGDVLVPLVQALVTGGFLGGLLVLVLYVFGVEGDLGAVWSIATLALASMAWVILLGQHRKLLWATEELVGADLDGDDQAGEPRERLVFVNRQRARQQTARERQRDEWETFTRFVRELGHRGTTMAAWERVIGRERYCEYRDALLDYGFARWRSYNADGGPNTSQGWELTATPAEVLASLSEG